jgi:phosphatase NudJ
MSRDPIPTWTFVLLVVKRGDRFLLVQEAKSERRWFFPGGRVEPGEELYTAAHRETREEAGIEVQIDGILRIEYRPRSDKSARARFFFLAHPIDDTPPKSIPDDESLGAAWVSLADLDRMPLRGDEVRQVLHAVAKGHPVYPVSVVTREGMPW